MFRLAEASPYIAALFLFAVLCVTAPVMAQPHVIRMNESEQIRVLVRSALRNGEYERVVDHALALIQSGYHDREIAGALNEALNALNMPAASAIVDAMGASDPARELVEERGAAWVSVVFTEVPEAWQQELVSAAEYAMGSLGDASLRFDNETLTERFLSIIGNRVRTEVEGNRIEVKSLWFRPGQSPGNVLINSRSAGAIEMRFNGRFRAEHVFSLGTLRFVSVGQGDRLYIDDNPVQWFEEGTVVSAGAHYVRIDVSERSGRSVNIEQRVEVPNSGTVDVQVPPTLVLSLTRSCDNYNYYGLESARNAGLDAWVVQPNASYDIRICCEGYLPVDVRVLGPNPGDQLSVFVDSGDLVRIPRVQSERRSRWLKTAGWGLAAIGVGAAIQSYVAFDYAENHYNEMREELYVSDAEDLAEEVDLGDTVGGIYAGGSVVSLGVGSTLLWLGYTGVTQGGESAMSGCYR